MDYEDTIKNKLYEIIANYCLYKKEELNLSLDLVNDLGCWGDDAYDLIEEICVKFKIDCIDFNPNDVTGSEGLDYKRTILNPKYLYKLLFEKEKTKIPKFTIGMLFKAIKTKKLKSIRPSGYYYAKVIEPTG